MLYNQLFHISVNTFTLNFGEKRSTVLHSDDSSDWSSVGINKISIKTNYFPSALWKMYVQLDLTIWTSVTVKIMYLKSFCFLDFFHLSKSPNEKNYKHPRAWESDSDASVPKNPKMSPAMKYRRDWMSCKETESINQNLAFLKKHMIFMIVFTVS